MPISEATFNIKENAESLENLLYSILKGAFSKDEAFLKIVLNHLKIEKEGSIGRHFFVIKLLSEIDAATYQATFYEAC